MHQACAGTRQYAPKATPSAVLQTLALVRDAEEASASQYLTEKACRLPTTPFPWCLCLVPGKLCLGKAWLMQEMVKILHPFASASRGSTVFFFFPPPAGEGAGVGGQLRAAICSPWDVFLLDSPGPRLPSLAVLGWATAVGPAAEAPLRGCCS